MKSILYLIVLLGLAATAGGADGPEAPQELLWPLPVDPPAITGTFMEFREGRFHSGMDLRTQGREGLPVVAPADGSIVRLRTSPTGYGVAVYLRLDDGRMLVFGHLSVLSDRLRQPVLKAWQKTGRYQQYLYLKPGELRVERGELLALSGSTGVGAPHLHLEVRDAQERPLNPQLHGFAVPDTVAPKITEIRVVPLGQRAHVDGERAAKVFEPGASFSAAGTLGVMVRIDDRTGYSPFRVGPLGVVVEVDGEEVYRLENEVFAFSQTGQMRLEEFDDPENPKKNWLRLYRRPGNELPDRVESGPPGTTFVAREGEEHQLTIRAWDVNGQSGGGTVFIWGSAPASVEARARYEAERSMGSSVPGRAWNTEVAGGSGVHEHLLPGSPSLRVSSFEVSWRNGGLYPGGSMWWGQSQGDPPPGTVDPRILARLEGAGVVVDEGVVFSVTADADDLQTLGLFLQDESGRWSFLAPMSEEPGVWSATMPSLGSIALARDISPPELGAFRIGQRALENGETIRPVAREQMQDLTLPDWPAVRIELRDLAAGIPDDGLETLLDGKPWPARWEPEDEVLVYEWWLDPGPGEHELTVKARDGLGNASEASIRLIFQR